MIFGILTLMILIAFLSGVVYSSSSYDYANARQLAVEAYLSAPINTSEISSRSLGQTLNPNSYSTFKNEIKHGEIILENGIPYFNYKTYGFCRIPKQILLSPIIVASYALSLYDQGLMTEFLQQANWLVNNQQDGAWEFHFPAPCYGISSNWKSALAQGLGISVLLRAYQLTGNQIYFEGASKAVVLLETTTNNGGTLGKLGNGLFPEEYPGKPTPNVLNGGITALYGLWEYAHVTGNKKANQAFVSMSVNLANNIQKYNIPGWALYYYRPTPTPLPYMSLQTRQMFVMYKLTKLRPFYQMWSEWLYNMEYGNEVAFDSYCAKMKISNKIPI